MIIANNEKKEETTGTAAGFLNDRMMLSVTQMHTAARHSGREKLGCRRITVPWWCESYQIAVLLVGGCRAIVIMREKWL